jgi:hypothetical protein
VGYLKSEADGATAVVIERTTNEYELRRDDGGDDDADGDDDEGDDDEKNGARYDLSSIDKKGQKAKEMEGKDRRR